MGYKTISLSEEAYNRLLERKAEGESFSDVVLKLTRNSTLKDLVGILSENDCLKLEKNIEKIRKNRLSMYQKSIEDDWLDKS